MTGTGQLLSPASKNSTMATWFFSEDLVSSAGKDSQRMWARYGEQIYDLTDYFHTQSVFQNVATYKFLDGSVSDLWKNNPGQDIKSLLDGVYSRLGGEPDRNMLW